MNNDMTFCAGTDAELCKTCCRNLENRTLPKGFQISQTNPPIKDGECDLYWEKL